MLSEKSTVSSARAIAEMISSKTETPSPDHCAVSDCLLLYILYRSEELKPP